MELTGTIVEIIFYNEENGYAVAVLETDQTYMTIVGNISGLEDGQRMQITGSLIDHKTYGEQFKVESYRFLPPEEKDQIIKFLSSSTISGIGEATAKKIVGHFGSETLDVLRFRPDRLLEINGIGEQKLGKIIASYEKTMSYQDTIMFLQSLHLGPVTVNKVLKKYGAKAEEYIRKNPYRLYEEVEGLGFHKTDEIAKLLGIKPDDPARIRAFILHLISDQSMEGHTYVTLTWLLRTLGEEMNLDDLVITQQIEELVTLGTLMMVEAEEETRLYKMSLFHAERNVIARLLSLQFEPMDPFIVKEKSLADYESQEALQLSPKQKEAVFAALAEKITIITGGPGTGKTTIVKAIVTLLKDQQRLVKLAAPTGRAAKRMEEATGLGATTIHRLLEYQFHEEENMLTFGRTEEDPIKADVIIIDESSMVDIQLFSAMMNAIPANARLILLGDADQLPSVGPGKVLRDLIEAEVFKTVVLDEIFRQGEHSHISLNAHRINQGEMPLGNDKEGDFFFISERKQQVLQQKVIDYVSKRLPTFYKLDPLQDIQVIAPMKNGLAGTKELNKSLQASLNPPHKNKTELVFKSKTFREGDKVMQMKNNYNVTWQDRNTLVKGVGVFNGDIGSLERIDQDKKKVLVVFEDTKEVSFDFNELSDLELAYAITIHKSQGSEFPCVVIPISFVPGVLSSRNLLYTAVTRGKRLVVIVGDEKYVALMVSNKHHKPRNSSLSGLLKDAYEALHQ